MTTGFTFTGGCSHCLTMIDLQRQKNDLHNYHNLYINLKNKTRTTCFQCQWWSNCNPTKKNYGQSAALKGSKWYFDLRNQKRIALSLQNKMMMMMLTRTMTRTIMMVCSQERGNGGWERTLLLHSQSCEQQSSDQRSRGPDHGECCCDCGWLFWWGLYHW